MDEKITVAVLAGTTRERRESIKAAHYVAEFGRHLPGVEIIFVDPKDFTFNGDGNDPEGKDPRYTEITAKADAFFIVTPEYNHSFPGSLKRMLDSEMETYNHKPVAFAGVSNGGWGGTRAVESLVPAIRESGMVALSWDIFFPRVQDIFAADGAMLPQYKERYEKHLLALYKELVWMTRLFKRGRHELKEQNNR